MSTTSKLNQKPISILPLRKLFGYDVGIIISATTNILASILDDKLLQI